LLNKINLDSGSFKPSLVDILAAFRLFEEWIFGVTKLSGSIKKLITKTIDGFKRMQVIIPPSTSSHSFLWNEKIEGRWCEMKIVFNVKVIRYKFFSALIIEICWWKDRGSPWLSGQSLKGTWLRSKTWGCGFIPRPW